AESRLQPRLRASVSPPRHLHAFAVLGPPLVATHVFVLGTVTAPPRNHRVWMPNRLSAQVFAHCGEAAPTHGEDRVPFRPSEASAFRRMVLLARDRRAPALQPLQQATEPRQTGIDERRAVTCAPDDVAIDAVDHGRQSGRARHYGPIILMRLGAKHRQETRARSRGRSRGSALPLKRRCTGQFTDRAEPRVYSRLFAAGCRCRAASLLATLGSGQGAPPRGPASRTAACTCSRNCSKFRRNICASRAACVSYAAESLHVPRGKSSASGTPGTVSGTSSPNTGSGAVGMRSSVPASAARTVARVRPRRIRSPTRYGPPVQPVFTSQHCTPCCAIFSPKSEAYTLGARGRNGAPKQVEKVALGSVTPRSVPATLAVYPDRKWYIACAGERRAIGGMIPYASQVRNRICDGCPPTPPGTWFGM